MVCYPGVHPLGRTVEVDCKAVKKLEIHNVRTLLPHLVGIAVLAPYGGGTYEGDAFCLQEVLHLNEGILKCTVAKGSDD